MLFRPFRFMPQSPAPAYAPTFRDTYENRCLITRDAHEAISAGIFKPPRGRKIADKRAHRATDGRDSHESAIIARCRTPSCSSICRMIAPFPA